MREVLKFWMTTISVVMAVYGVIIVIKVFL